MLVLFLVLVKSSVLVLVLFLVVGLFFVLVQFRVTGQHSTGLRPGPGLGLCFSLVFILANVLLPGLVSVLVLVPASVLNQDQD